eukprot:16050545-Heterocapsa_arctica.AAC.1
MLACGSRARSGAAEPLNVIQTRPWLKPTQTRTARAAQRRCSEPISQSRPGPPSSSSISELPE